MPMLTNPSDSAGVQENGFPPTRNRDCVCLPPQVLSQKLLLRDRPFYRNRCVLLCRRQGRGIPSPYQDCRQRISFRF